MSASVFPLNFSPVVLITIYAMVILGGSGSQPGVVLGAILVNVLLQVLQNPGQARVLFYLVIVLGVVATFRLSVEAGATSSAATAVFGIVVHAIAASLHHAWVNGDHGGVAGAIVDLGGRARAARDLGRPGCVRAADRRRCWPSASCKDGCAWSCSRRPSTLRPSSGRT